MRQLNYSKPGFYLKLARFCERVNAVSDVRGAVAKILCAVKEQGDKAIIDYTAKFDRAKLKKTQLRVTRDELNSAAKTLSTDQRKAIKNAIHCVKEFHQKSLPKNWKGKNPHGGIVGETFYPINRVGIYIPGGIVPLVSTVIMTTTLARLARVPEIAVFTPPQSDGNVNSGVLAALAINGIEEVYLIGGVMAVGAMAYGTATIPAVDKIYGPGNAYVFEAKKQVYGIVGLDLLPGPSELMIIADSTARADYIAADLLAQAEHGTGMENICLITNRKKLIDEMRAELKTQLRDLNHKECIETVLRDGTLSILVNNLDQAVEIANYVAPEHLELHVGNRYLNTLTKKIKNAGAIFIGDYTPTVLGDFAAGPSHVLPTGRTARFMSGLRVTDFFRRSSITQYSPKSLVDALPVVEAFSKLEQLDAHGRSMQIRFK